MKNTIKKGLLQLCAMCGIFAANAQVANIDLTDEKQTVRGFGGINHPVWIADLTAEQCSTAFGNGDDQLGFSILRIWVSDNKDQWSRELTTAKRAAGLGAIVFATPWNPPAGMTETVSRNGRNEKRLKYGSYQDYTDHLNAFNDYMYKNGVSLHGISFANEPDYGHDWTWYSVDEVYNYTKNYAGQLRKNGAKVITAESFAYSKGYYDKILNDANALKNIDIIGTHFYASDANTPNSFFQYPLADQKAADKERWMTEHYTTSETSTTDQVTADLWPLALDVSYEIHRAMVEGNFNAYVWWYIRRHYGPIKEDGKISKRGYCMAQYSKFVRPGYVRVAADSNPTYNVYVSAYKKNDDVVIVAVNRSTVSKTLTFSVPGTKVKSWTPYVTSGSKNLTKGSDVAAANGSFQITLEPQSTTTFVGKASAGGNEVVEPEQPETTDDPSKAFDGVALTKGYKDQSNHNTLMTQRFGADPYAMVYNDEVFVYMTNDVYEYDANGNLTTNSYGKINTINCISSKDMVNWTDHGSMNIAGRNNSAGAAKWATCSWAPSAMHAKVDGKDKFFLYFANNGSGIGVVTSDTPYGPWTDPIGKELVSRSTPTCSTVNWLFDPAVLMDDDGTAYLYFGGGVPEGKAADPGTARVVKLGKDYISLDGNPVAINPPYLFEDAGANKVGDKYLYSYCSNWNCKNDPMSNAQICYMTSDSPMGPFTYTGMVFKNPGDFFPGSWGNNHHAIFEFKDKWYITYHALVLQNNMGIEGGYRSTHIDYIPVNESNSTIGQAKGTLAGVEQVQALNPFVKTEAETMAWMGGINTKEGGSNMVVSSISKGDWIGLSGVDFGSGANKFIANVSSNKKAFVKICLDKADGEVVGYLEVPNTGGKFQTVTADLSTAVSGDHDLFFVFSGEFEFDYWMFGVAEEQGPYEGVAQTIPGVIEAERYDTGGEGVAYHDEEIENKSGAFRNDGVDVEGDDESGYKVGWTISGEWLSYTVDVKETAVYNWTATVSSANDNASFRMFLDGEEITDLVEVPNTEDWGVYAEVSGKTAELTAGTHLLKIYIEGSWFNLDKIVFAGGSATESGLVLNNEPMCGVFDVFSLQGVCLKTVNVEDGDVKTVLVAAGFADGVYLLRSKDGKLSRLAVVK